MRKARFRFEGDLALFLAPELRGTEFEHSWPESDSLKHVIESLGVPHTEVARTEMEGNLIRVLPHGPEHLADARFILDGHLGRLAAYLRMLGFDVLYESHSADEQIASLSSREKRVLLTRDVGLLKRNEVYRGYFVRSTQPRIQLEETIRRFELFPSIAPFTRCIKCNMPLRSARKEEVIDRLPTRIRELHDEFTTCPCCGSVYWKGTHYDRMNDWIRRLATQSSTADPSHPPSRQP